MPSPPIAPLPFSLEWFSDAEIRFATLRLVRAGTCVDEMQTALDETLKSPKARAILHCLSLYAYGLIFEHFRGVTPQIDDALNAETEIAEAVSNFEQTFETLFDEEVSP
jgi:hypothetical protein